MKIIDMRAVAIASILLFICAIVNATDFLAGVNDATFNLCGAVIALLPIVAMLMIVIAGVIYAAGQMMGAETRARANVWATAALTGALIAILIYAIAPKVLTAILGEGVNCDVAIA